MGSPERRRLPRGVEGLSSRWGFVRGPITDADRERLDADYQPGWRMPVVDAVRWYMRHPVPGSRVHPKWVPVSWLAETFEPHGLTVDGLVAVLSRLVDDGYLTQRAMRLGGVDHAVVTLDEVYHVRRSDRLYRPVPGGVRLPGGAALMLGGVSRGALDPG